MATHEQDTEAIRPARERVLRSLGYDLDSTPADTHIVFTTSAFGRSFIEIDTGAETLPRHYIGDLTDAQNRALKDLIEQGRSAPPHLDLDAYRDFVGEQT